jgi:hypothetical protein
MANKVVCLDTEVRPIKGKCFVYSFGVNNKWSFEDIIDEYGCDTHSTRKRTHSGLSLNKFNFLWLNFFVNNQPAVPFFNRLVSHLNILRKLETEGDDQRDSCLYKAMEQRHGHGRSIIDYPKHWKKTSGLCCCKFSNQEWRTEFASCASRSILPANGTNVDEFLPFDLASSDY